jgi:hypothetical protein
VGSTEATLIFIDRLDPLIEQAMKLRAEQWRLWEAEQIAQAQVDHCNYLLDRLTEEFGTAKLASLRKENPHWKEKEARDSSEFQLYVKKSTINEITRLGLESELPVVAPWPALISREADASLHPFAVRFEKIIGRGREVVAARSLAQSKTSEHRVRQINSFIKDVNDARTSIHGQLLALSTTLKLPKTWADNAFRKGAAPSGLSRDEARGIASTILTVLALRSLALTDEQRKRLTTNQDLALFDQWRSRLLSAQSAEELLA